jgi:hypothetical protein
VKGESDRGKYEKARMLKTKIGKIRKDYAKDLDSTDLKEKQRATTLWIIDRLALRVGNEKSEDEADTVGCTSLRWEHVEPREPLTLHFDFLGKDCVRFEKDVDLLTECLACERADDRACGECGACLKDKEVNKKIYRNIVQFRKGGKAGDPLFELIDPTVLNKYLNELMPGLSAKVRPPARVQYSRTLHPELSARGRQAAAVSSAACRVNDHVPCRVHDHVPCRVHDHDRLAASDLHRCLHVPHAPCTMPCTMQTYNTGTWRATCHVPCKHASQALRIPLPAVATQL